ncbi:MAG: hypothetical protein ABL953_10535 [Ilumatobacteraceae bacterium]
MLAPALSAHTDLLRHHVAIAVTGPLTTEDHAAALTAACLPLPPTYGLLVNLSDVTDVTEAGMNGLRRLAADASAAGHVVAFVCSKSILREALLLWDLDAIAPVLQHEDEAVPLVGYAA